MTTVLQDILDRFRALPADKQAELKAIALKHAETKLWVPTPGPQLDAYNCEADVLLYGGQAGGGKALDLNTPIATPFGWTTMGRIEVGDLVYDERGAETKVIATSQVMIGRPCYRVRFSDGAEIIADADHQWLTLTSADRDAFRSRSAAWRKRRRDNRPSRGTGKRPDVAARNRKQSVEYEPPAIVECVRTTAEIAATLRIGERANHSVKVADAIFGRGLSLPIDPYLLGAWLGDGTSAGARICIAEPEMVHLVNDAVASHGWEMTKGSSKYDYGIRGGLKVALAQASLLKAKAIPQVYLRASTNQRIALLQGLMDTDGYVDSRGQCEFTNTNETLALGVVELIRSLGCKATITVGVATLYGRAIGAKYRIKFLAPFEAFRLQRKFLRQKRSDFRQTVTRRYIEDVESVCSTPVRCIQVDSPSRLYLSGPEMVPTHNSDLILGLAFTKHKSSLILRRQYTDLGALTTRAIEINRTRKGYNGSIPPKISTQDGRLIQFGALQRLGDEESFQGRPNDLLVFDEAVQFLESQVRFLIAWNRSVERGQRCRIVMASNPPVGIDGEWIIPFFAPWLDPTYYNPAKPGELRWFVTNEDSKDMEVPGPERVKIGGKMVKPMSRTFIPATLSDNPFLTATDAYAAKLDSLPEPYKSAFRDGNFMLARKDAEQQVIPTQWVREAQARWSPNPPPGVPMCAIGVDCARGGDSDTVLAVRHDAWFAPLERTPGVKTPTGPDIAGLVVARRRDNAAVIIDMGGGYGGSPYDHLKGNLPNDWLGQSTIVPFKGAEKSMARTADNQLGFTNNRSASYWAFREALDPSQVGGSPVALPPDPALVADLTAPTFEVTARGIKVEPKEDVTAKLGRSPDGGDAVVMSWVGGQRYLTHGQIWGKAANNVIRMPTVIRHRAAQREFVRR